MDTHFVVTLWRNPAELLELRRDLYHRGDGSTNSRQRAVDKVFAWRSRKQEIPLLLDSTADIVDVTLQDEQNKAPHNSLRLLYATAIARFITGVSDTQTTLLRDRPSWFTAGQSIQLPTNLLETRHRIVHRHLPTLAELKRAAKESLDWLWEWYWSQLDLAFSQPGRVNRVQDSTIAQDDAKAAIQKLLKTYVRDRKTEIKAKRGNKEPSAAAATASSNFLAAWPHGEHAILLDALVADHAVLPADKKLRSSMSGAFLVWTPFLQALCESTPAFLLLLIDALMRVLNAAPGSAAYAVDVRDDPVREGMCEWLSHIVSSSSWRDVRAALGARGRDAGRDAGRGRRVVDHVLGQCFTTPSYWNLRLAGALLRDEATAISKSDRDGWLLILEAAKNEDATPMDVDTKVVATEGGGAEVDYNETAQPVSAVNMAEPRSKVRGPQKMIGLWRPQPIGALLTGSEEDE